MKKILTLIFVLTLAVTMCACEGITQLKEIDLPPLPDVDATAEPTAQPSPEPTLPAVMRTSVYYDHILEESFDPADGTKLILSFSYDALKVHIDGRDEASSAINEYIARIDETYYTGNDYGAGSSTGKSKLLELAEDNYRYAYETDALDSNLEYSSSQTADVTRADDTVLALRYYDYVYTGGAHGSYGYKGYVFDCATGERLTLDMLSGDGEGLKQFLVEQLTAQAASDDIKPLIDENMVPADKASEIYARLLRDGSWYLDAQGLVIFPDLGEISAYAAGIVEFKIPYSELKGKIDDKWLPSGRTAGGELKAAALEDVQDGSMEIADKITADADGRQVCIIADGSLYDVKLSRVEYSDKFYETQRLWYCGELSNCAVQVVTNIPDGMPDLMISYRTADGELVNRLISESGLDGSIVLVEDNIEAVG